MGAWELHIADIPEAERGDLLSAYYRRLTSDDPAVRLVAAMISSGWEGATSKLLPDAAFTAHYEEDEFALAFARIEAHQAQHGFTFFAAELRHTAQFIGFIGMVYTPFEARFTPCVEIGWRLSAECWGQGSACLPSCAG